MLISPPFLVARNADEYDTDYIARCMPDTGVMVSGTGVPEGSYPVSFKMGWHGGLHLQAPADANNSLLPVSAIADGEIVYARKPTKPNDKASPEEPRNYNPYGDTPAWTDDGCVIIRHRVKMGSPQPDQTVEITFLSIYMHLSELRGAAKSAASPTATGTQPVKRKDVIGLSGKVYGQGGQLHLEIVCDDDNLKRMVGRATGDGTPNVNGRNDLVFGEVYFQLPVGAKFYAERPAYNTATPTAAASYTLQDKPIYVGIAYGHGDGGVERRGEARITTYQQDGSILGDFLREVDGEYELYQTALDISQSYPTAAAPSPNVIYELLRFGRVIGPTALSPADLPHWREVRYPGGRGWVNLNATGVLKSSDADFPSWRGWKLIDDDTDGDSRCDSAQLMRLIASFRGTGQSWDTLAPKGQCKGNDGGMTSAGGWQTSVENPDAADGSLAGVSNDTDGPPTRAKLESRLKLDSVRKALKLTLCKLPSEWDQASAEARWKWLLTDKDFGLEQPDFDELMAHIKALTFDWGAANTGIGTTHWHFQPREFMRLFRTFCAWPDLIRRWREAEAGHQLPNDDGLDDFGKTALYEYGLRASLAAIRDHRNRKDLAPFQALDKRNAVIFGMRVHTDINVRDGKGDWDDRVTLFERDNTGLVEMIFRGRYTTEPSGRYLDGGKYLVPGKEEGANVGGTAHRDIGRLIADRSYQYAPLGHNNTTKYGAKRFGNHHFNILRKTDESQAERLVTNTTTLANNEKVSEANAHWQTGSEAGYNEHQTMLFHKGYQGMTGSGGCQTYPVDGNDTFDHFMKKLEPLKASDRFQYVLRLL